MAPSLQIHKHIVAMTAYDHTHLPCSLLQSAHQRQEKIAVVRGDIAHRAVHAVDGLVAAQVVVGSASRSTLSFFGRNERNCLAAMAPVNQEIGVERHNCGLRLQFTHAHQARVCERHGNARVFGH